MHPTSYFGIETGRQFQRYAARREHRAAFTLIEVLVVVAIIALLIAILLPSLSRARELSRRSVCLSNEMQLQKANVFYLADWKTVFPPTHFKAKAGEPGGDADGEKHWFNLLERYTKSREVPHCPTLASNTQRDRTIWGWSYDKDGLGYGYNGFFLGLYDHPDGEIRHHIVARRWWRESKLKKPSWNILFADSNPRAGSNDLSCTLWWPNVNSKGEGVNDNRHLQGGCVVFNDGHAEYRRKGTINPAEDGTDQFIQYWDPLMRRIIPGSPPR